MKTIPTRKNLAPRVMAMNHRTILRNDLTPSWHHRLGRLAAR
jgi:hypothetical protein